MIINMTDTTGQKQQDMREGITSALNDYSDMTDIRLRSTLEVERGLYMAESRNVIERAITAGHQPRSFLMAPRWLDALRPLILRATGDADGGNIPVFIAPEEQLEGITGFHLHRGALACMYRPHMPSIKDLLLAPHDAAPKKRRIAVLEDLVDHTNVGAVFRSAAALGVEAVLVSPRCADPLYRRSVRVSMGSVFQIPWTRIPSWPILPAIKEQGFTTVALTPNKNSIPLDDFAQLPVCTSANSHIALVLGAEGDGLSHRTIEDADYTVHIPMPEGIDSLNVAAASAVAFWETRDTQ